MIKVEIPQLLLTEEWTKLPKPRERYEGLSRTTLLELWEQGDIKIAAIRKPGSQKAIRLLHVPSLKAYLKTCIEEPHDTPSPRKRAGNTKRKTKIPTPFGEGGAPMKEFQGDL
jgi:hypothetical protein